VTTALGVHKRDVFDIALTVDFKGENRA
ncbi:MAG: hypothetical protein RLZZ330_723, partial [Actinomycetota bacterium]